MLTGIERIAQSLDVVNNRCAGFTTKLLLECTAGQGSAIGWQFEQLAEILKRVRHADRLGVCLDTCHLVAAGYDYSTPEKYVGKRIRMTGNMKSKDVTNWAGFWLRVDQADSQQPLSFDNMQDRSIKGTTEWKKYEIILDVPINASKIAFGALLVGIGQIWFDNLHFEIVDKSVQTTGQKE
jgi:hypothetical protein